MHPVHVTFMSRKDAEKKYGFMLYQGGVVPGDTIRVLDVEDIDVEACGGTHIKNTGEIGTIKITGSEKVQDGVERLIYSAGPSAINYIQKRENMIKNVSENISTSVDNLEPVSRKLYEEYRDRGKETFVMEVQDDAIAVAAHEVESAISIDVTQSDRVGVVFGA